MDKDEDTKQAMIDHFVDKALKNADFKKKLFEFPRETIENELNIKMTNELESKLFPLMNQITEKINLMSHESSDELTDLQIEKIAGGAPEYPTQKAHDLAKATIMLVKEFVGWIKSL